MDATRKVPLLGVMAATMIVTMSMEIVPIGYHINLTVLAGALLGPALGFICAFIVDVILALLGHGGVTVVGLNALMMGSEVCLGWLLFKLLSRLAGRARLRPAAAVATVCTLALTTTMVIGLVAVARIDPGAATEAGALDPSALRIENPFARHTIERADTVRTRPASSLSIGRFATVLYVLAVPGWIIEAVLVSFVVGFIAKVRPDLLGLGPPPALPIEPVEDYGRY
jgi:cobalt/nickel transport system permease protein